MRKLALVALAICLATPAFSANNFVMDSVTTFPTFHSIGVRVYYTGDDDSSATVVGLVRLRGYQTWDTLPRFVRISLDNFPTWAGVTGQKMLASSVLWCGSDSTYDLKIEVTDAGGCTRCDNRSTVTTWKDNREAWSNTATSTVYIGPYGNDSNAGTRDAPKATWAGATALMTDPGSRLIVLPGTYYVQRTDSLYVGVDTKNGTSANPYTVLADGNVVFSGADTTALRGDEWGSKVVYSGVTAYVKTGFAAPRYPRHVGVDDTLRLYPYKTFYKFCTDPYGMVTNWGASWVTDDGDSVFIRMPSSLGTPLGHTIHIPSKNAAVRIESSFWRISGITFKDFGVKVDNSTTNSVINMANQGGVVERCNFVRLSRPAVGIRTYFDNTEFRTQWNTVQRNNFSDALLSSPWDRAASAATGIGSSNVINPGSCSDSSCQQFGTVYPAMIVEAGRGHVFRYNKVRGWPDGFVRFTNSFADTSQKALTDCDIYRNEIVNMAGDAIEPDAASGLNMRVYKNTILGGASALSFTMLRGPFYFVYNTCINQIGPFQPTGVNVDEARGHLFVVNNSVFSSASGSTNALWKQPSSVSFNAYVNKVVVNNAFYNSSGPVFYEAGCLLLNEFNWNKFASGGSRLAWTNYGGNANPLVTSLTAWRDSTYGYGKNDAIITSLALVDSTAWNWAPAAGGELTSGARSMPGINTNNQCHCVHWAPSNEGFVGAWQYDGRRREQTDFDERQHIRQRCRK